MHDKDFVSTLYLKMLANKRRDVRQGYVKGRGGFYILMEMEKEILGGGEK